MESGLPNVQQRAKRGNHLLMTGRGRRSDIYGRKWPRTQMGLPYPPKVEIRKPHFPAFSTRLADPLISIRLHRPACCLEENLSTSRSKRFPSLLCEKHLSIDIAISRFILPGSLALHGVASGRTNHKTMRFIYSIKPAGGTASFTCATSYNFLTWPVTFI